MKIAVIGAGFAGLSAGKVLTQFGHDCTVFEKARDVGGVWSATRRYPGLRTQNNKDTYCYSDFPMPASYPEWPSAAQVQQYLADYAAHFDLTDRIRLNCEVISAEPDTAGPGPDRWNLTVRNGETGEVSVHHADVVIVANGIFSVPMIPSFPGRDEFEKAGGRVGATSDFHSLDEVRGKNVLVVGYGKSACDAAAAVGEVAASTKVIARQLIWKMPRRILKVLNYKYLMLTRMGEGLFPYFERHGVERFLNDGAGRPLRRALISSLQWIATHQYGLHKLGLVPEGSFERIGRSTVSLVTDELFGQAADGRVDIVGNCEITSLGVRDGQLVAELSVGRTVPADVVICGTGFHQVTPFFSDDIKAKLHDADGNFLLYRQVFPIDIANLYFSGYNSSFYSPLSAEVAALVIAAHLMGEFTLPPRDEMRDQLRRRLRWMEERTEGHHAKGTNIIPFSMHNIDEMLGPVGLNVSRFTRFKQWLLPTKAADYQRVTKKLLRRQRELNRRAGLADDAIGSVARSGSTGEVEHPSSVSDIPPRVDTESA